MNDDKPTFVYEEHLKEAHAAALAKLDAYMADTEAMKREEAEIKQAVEAIIASGSVDDPKAINKLMQAQAKLALFPAAFKKRREAIEPLVQDLSGKNAELPASYGRYKSKMYSWMEAEIKSYLLEELRIPHVDALRLTPELLALSEEMRRVESDSLTFIFLGGTGIESGDSIAKVRSKAIQILLHFKNRKP